jgi:Holliday junction DNA helicase RuvA
MISSIKGTVISINNGTVEVQLKAIGLGFVLFVPNADKFELNQDISFYTYLHWNQEKGPSLFGFEDKTQRVLFTTVIACSGIGPKMGVAIVEQLGVPGFINAIEQHDIKAMSSVSGIGAKKAEQIIVQLKHKVDKLVEQKEFANIGGFGHAIKIREVLSSLNYSTPEIVRAIDHAKQVAVENDESFDVALRCALSFLSKNV